MKKIYTISTYTFILTVVQVVLREPNSREPVEVLVREKPERE